ncbi:ATP-grasp domain-containing protein [Streptomyces jumonjinensis]|uniref:ATP-grasp domain-containing protein n=1 Tax=Streptomyces jumonjinensis TaxID=1945 RepID=A0A646KLU4_STRJU|nr:ATP-grasp domain-containing protein [Streptomyces jumonjinensis]MQT03007.1 ATP-grasp domain-containing protein [Streptomyces jumonjinensis]
MTAPLPSLPSLPSLASLESLSFGLARTAEAAAARGHRLCLLTGDRSVYRHELATLPPDALDVIDVDTTDMAAVRRVLDGLPSLAGLINTTDTWSAPAAELAVAYGLPGPDPAAVRLLRDKARVRDALHRAGVSDRAALVLERRPGQDGIAGGIVDGVADQAARAARVVEAVGLPAVLKDSSGTSSRGVWIVRDTDGLRAALAEAAEAPLKGELFAEPFLAGPLYSAETLSWAGETRLLGVSSRQTSRTPAVREEGAAFPVALPPGDHDGLEKWAGRVLDAAGHDQGFAHVEFVLTAHGPELVEINRRIGGALIGEALCRSLQVNVYDALVDAALGRRPALLDTPVRTAGPAVAFVLVYPDRAGTLTGWRGLDGLGAYPGEVEWYPVRAPGDAVPDIGDQRGCTGMVLAEAATAELAQHRAWSAATSVRPVMRPAAGP